MAQMNLEEIRENIFFVRGEKKGRFPFSHSVLIKGGFNVLIDAGCGLSRLRAIQEDHPLDMVIYSHAHTDHCSGCWYFPTEIVCGPEEWSSITGDLQRMAGRFIPPPLQEDWIAFMREQAEFRDFRPGRIFRRNQTFDFGKIKMETVYTPGHCQDHYCFYFPDEELMLTTDIDLTPFGPWYGNPESDIDDFIASIEKLRGYDIETAVSSHRGVLTDGMDALFDQFLEAFEVRDRRILDFLRSPRTMDDFVTAALIYGRFPYRESVLQCWESQMIAKHLKRLVSKGLVAETNGKYTRL
jgi:glyoxylase-like metal-dependent hydrolase (beta-lactamase superfamily II)